MRGYRGFTRELARTRSFRSLQLQLRTGIAHVLRAALRRPPRVDAVELFLRNYQADGVRLGDPQRPVLRGRAQACLVCGLCSAECARVGGRPALDPRDAVLSAARLEAEALRRGIVPMPFQCGACDACEAVCPAGIPIRGVQQGLAALRGDDPSTGE